MSAKRSIEERDRANAAIALRAIGQGIAALLDTHFGGPIVVDQERANIIYRALISVAKGAGSPFPHVKRALRDVDHEIPSLLEVREVGELWRQPGDPLSATIDRLQARIADIILELGATGEVAEPVEEILKQVAQFQTQAEAAALQYRSLFGTAPDATSAPAILFTGEEAANRRQIVEIGEHRIELSDNPFRLLFRLAIKLRRDGDGSVSKEELLEKEIIAAGADQAIGRLREQIDAAPGPLRGRELIVSSGSGRIGLDPRRRPVQIADSLLHHPDALVAGYARESLEPPTQERS